MNQKKKWLEIRRTLSWFLKRGRRKVLIVGGIAALAIGVVCIVLSRRTYGSVRELQDFSREGSDHYYYAEFSGGIVRYSRDGIVYLDYENEEQWNQPDQMQNPEIAVNENAFVIADIGGNSLMIFTEEGLKGEITTTLPIEKAAVSNQGIVAALLKSENLPRIMVYDTAGNILVEHQTTMQGMGYPISIALSDDAGFLLVSYLSVKDMALESKVVYYNYGDVGQNRTDNQVTADTYEDTVIPTTFFADRERSVAISDSGFVVYSGSQIPEVFAEVKLDKEIKSAFHSEKYVGFVLKNPGTANCELRLYNLNGKKVMSENFRGEYGNIKLSDGQIILWEGSRACIFRMNGSLRFQGDLEMEVSEIVPLPGWNTYLLMNGNTVKEVRLTD